MTSYMEHLHMYNKMAANNLHEYDFLYGTLTYVTTKWLLIICMHMTSYMEHLPDFSKRLSVCDLVTKQRSYFYRLRY